MIDCSKISADSPLLDAKTKETIQGVFAKLDRDVVIKAAVDLKEEKSLQLSLPGGCSLPCRGQPFRLHHLLHPGYRIAFSGNSMMQKKSTA